MTMTEAIAVLAMKPADLLNMSLVNAHRLENSEAARDDALVRIAGHEAVLAAKDTQLQAVLAANVGLESVLGVTDGGKALLEQREKDAKDAKRKQLQDELAAMG